MSEHERTVAIRALGMDDLEQALQFVWEVYARTEAHARDDEAVQDFLSKIDFEYCAVRVGDGQLRLWGAFSEEKLIGVCAFLGLNRVYLLYVDPRAQGQGVATRLLKRAVFDSKRHDDTLPRLIVEAPDTAVGFFGKQGFVPIGEPTEDCGVWYTVMELTPES